MSYLLSSFSILHRQSEIVLSRKLARLELSSNQFIYIMCLCDHPGISQEQMSSLLRIDKGSVAKSIQQLSAMGYIDRCVSETDKRQYRLLPTQKALDLYPHLQQVVQEYESQVTKDLTSIEKDILHSLLEKLMGNV